MAITNQISQTEAYKRARSIRDLASVSHHRDKKRYEAILAAFWKSGDQATPQQVADVLGTDAGDLFQYVGALRTFILTVNPNAQLTPPNSLGTWTVNPDGTVTINSVNQ